MGNDKNAESLLRELFKNNCVDKLNIYKDKFGCYVARVRFTNPDDQDQVQHTPIALRRKSDNQIQRDIDRAIRFKDASTSMRSDMKLRSRNTKYLIESPENSRECDSFSVPVRSVELSPVMDQAECCDFALMTCDQSFDCSSKEIEAINSDEHSLCDPRDSSHDIEYQSDVIPPLPAIEDSCTNETNNVSTIKHCMNGNDSSSLACDQSDRVSIQMSIPENRRKRRSPKDVALIEAMEKLFKMKTIISDDGKTVTVVDAPT